MGENLRYQYSLILLSCQVLASAYEERVDYYQLCFGESLHWPWGFARLYVYEGSHRCFHACTLESTDQKGHSSQLCLSGAQYVYSALPLRQMGS